MAERSHCLEGRGKVGRVGIGRWTAFSLETRPVAASLEFLAEMLRLLVVVAEEGGRREREREGKPDGMERTRGRRGQALVGDVQVSSRAKILHFDVSQFYLIVCNALVAGDFFIDLFVENNTSNACNFV